MEILWTMLPVCLIVNSMDDKMEKKLINSDFFYIFAHCKRK